MENLGQVEGLRQTPGNTTTHTVNYKGRSGMGGVERFSALGFLGQLEDDLKTNP